MQSVTDSVQSKPSLMVLLVVACRNTSSWNMGLRRTLCQTFQTAERYRNSFIRKYILTKNQMRHPGKIFFGTRLPSSGFKFIDCVCRQFRVHPIFTFDCYVLKYVLCQQICYLGLSLLRILHTPIRDPVHHEVILSTALT